MSFSWFYDNPVYLHPLRDVVSKYDLKLAFTLWSFLMFYSAFILMTLTAKGRRVSTGALGSVSFLSLYALVMSFIDCQWFVAQDTDFEGGESRLAVSVGLKSFNVTYSHSKPDHLDLAGHTFTYVEEFQFKHESLVIEALKRGLPQPITIVAEYFSIENKTGMFSFPRKLVWIGQRVEAFLIATTTLFLLGMVASLTMPKYMVRTLLLNSFNMLCIVLYMYTQSGAGCADANLTIWVSGCPLSFIPGRTFYLMLAGGTANLLAALTVLIMIKFGMASSISTYLEIDYDTPWSSKKIVKEMEERRAQRKPKNIKNIWFTPESGRFYADSQPDGQPRSPFDLIWRTILAVGAFKNSASGVRRGSRGDGKSGAENSEEGFDSDGFENFWDHKQGDANNNNYMQTNKNEISSEYFTQQTKTHKQGLWVDKEWVQFFDILQTNRNEISSEDFTQ